MSLTCRKTSRQGRSATLRASGGRRWFGHRITLLIAAVLAVTAALVVNAASASDGTTTSLNASSGGSTSTYLTVSAGAIVSYTAAVSPTPDGGTVTFADSSGVLPGCSATAVDPSTGAAVCPETYLSPGSDTVTATFNGDAPDPSDSSGSSSTAVTVVVTGSSVTPTSAPAPTGASDTGTPIYTTAGLSTSPVPATFGDPVSYIVTITPVPDGGTVAFSDPATGVLSGCEAVPVDTSSGTATCTLTADEAGTSVILANYSGDTGYAGSGSMLEVATFGLTQTIAFGPSPATAPVGVTYPVSATGGASGNPVVFSIDSSSTPGTCTSGGLNGSTISLTGEGTCVIDADQDGTNTYANAAEVELSVTVGPAANSGSSGSSGSSGTGNGSSPTTSSTTSTSSTTITSSTTSTTSTTL